MLDFFKQSFSKEDKEKIDILLLKNTSLFNITGGFSHVTREAFEPFSGEWHNLKIKSQKNGVTFIQNSLHTLCNEIEGNGKLNTDDFTYTKLTDTIDALGHVFGEELLRCGDLTQLEFGLNVELNMGASDFVNKHIIMHQFKAPTYEENKAGIVYKKFIHEDFDDKTYAKGLKHKLKMADGSPFHNLLRKEIKYKGSDVIAKFGIKNIYDLKNRKNLELLFEDYISRISNDLMILDCIDCAQGVRKMTKGDRELIFKYSNPNYWAELKGKSKTTRNKHRKAPRELFERCKTISVKEDLISRLSEKFYYLLNN